MCVLPPLELYDDFSTTECLWLGDDTALTNMMPGYAMMMMLYAILISC